VNADLKNTDLTEFCVYVCNYIHHVTKFGLGLASSALVLSSMKLP